MALGAERLRSSAGDALLVSSYDEGFTAVVFRDKQPLIVRSIACEPEEREDEFYRLLLFYRDRPGMISEVTKIIAEEGINIASLSCSRKQRGKDAFMQIDVDSPMSDAALQRIRDTADVDEARYLDRIP